MHMAGRRPFFRGLGLNIETMVNHCFTRAIVFCIIEYKFVLRVIASCILLATQGHFFGFDRSPGGVLTWILVYLAGVVLTSCSPLGNLLSPLRNLGREKKVGIIFIAFVLVIGLKTIAYLATPEHNY